MKERKKYGAKAKSISVLKGLNFARDYICTGRAEFEKDSVFIDNTAAIKGIMSR